MSDCQIAFRGLPSGAVPTAWYNERAAGEERNVLPLMVHHGSKPLLLAKRYNCLIRRGFRHVRDLIPHVWSVRQECGSYLDRAKRHQSHGSMGAWALPLSRWRRSGYEGVGEHN